MNTHDLETALLNDEGYCTTCEDFTGGPVEPDAQGYTCPACGEPTLMGAEEALLTGAVS